LPQTANSSGCTAERQVDAAVQLYGAMGVEATGCVDASSAYGRNRRFSMRRRRVHFPCPIRSTPRGHRTSACTRQNADAGDDRARRGVLRPGALGLYPDIVRKHLGLGADQRLLFGISFGYEDPSVKQ